LPNSGLRADIARLWRGLGNPGGGPASVGSGAHRFHSHERPIPSNRDRDWGLPARHLGLHLEQGNPGLRRLRGLGGLVRQGHVDRGFARSGPMPRDRPRQFSDPAGYLGAVHPRPRAPRALRPDLRWAWAVPTQSCEAPPAGAAGPKTSIGTGRSRWGRLVSRRPICPNVIRFVYPRGRPRHRAPFCRRSADVASPLMETHTQWF